MYPNPLGCPVGSPGKRLGSVGFNPNIAHVLSSLTPHSFGGISWHVIYQVINLTTWNEIPKTVPKGTATHLQTFPSPKIHAWKTAAVLSGIRSLEFQIKNVSKINPWNESTWRKKPWNTTENLKSQIDTISRIAEGILVVQSTQCFTHQKKTYCWWKRSGDHHLGCIKTFYL